VIVTAAARVVRRAAAVCLLSLGVLTATGCVSAPESRNPSSR